MRICWIKHPFHSLFRQLRIQRAARQVSTKVRKAGAIGSILLVFTVRSELNFSARACSGTSSRKACHRVFPLLDYLACGTRRSGRTIRTRTSGSLISSFSTTGAALARGWPEWALGR